MSRKLKSLADVDEVEKKILDLKMRESEISQPEFRRRMDSLYAMRRAYFKAAQLELSWAEKERL